MEASSLWNIHEEEFPRSGTPHEQWLFLLRYAILAPSIYNSQPWRFEIRDRECRVFIDRTLALPHADPVGRAAFIALGACAENLIRAAQHFYILESWEVFDGHDRNLVASIRLRTDIDDGMRETRLFSAIQTRRAPQDGFLDRAIPDAALEPLRSQVGDHTTLSIVTDAGQRVALAESALQTIRQAYRSRAFLSERIAWIAAGKESHGTPAATLALPRIFQTFMRPLSRIMDVSRFTEGNAVSAFATAPMLCVLSASEDSPAAWVRVGMSMQRCVLYLASHEMQSFISVYAMESQEAIRRVQQILPTDAIPHVLLAVGYPRRTAPASPRHPVAEKLLSATS